MRSVADVFHYMRMLDSVFEAVFEDETVLLFMYKHRLILT